MRGVYFPELTGLRGLMAWWVVIGHVLYVFSDRLGQLSHNVSPVYVFVILSGFVIMALLDNKHERYTSYIVRRFFRLFPVYALLLVITALTLEWQHWAIITAPFGGGGE